MKKRLGFVSNSSSSSFIVVGEDELSYKDAFNGKTLFIGVEGNLCFGWEWATYDTLMDRINFCYLQALSVDNKEWFSMLARVITDHTQCSSIDYSILKKQFKSYNAYIDHQSNASDGANTEIFANDEILRNFLFRNDSYIKGGNDNDDY